MWAELLERLGAVKIADALRYHEREAIGRKASIQPLGSTCEAKPDHHNEGMRAAETKQQAERG